MNTRQSLNGLQPRTARDMERDAFDWCDGKIQSALLTPTQTRGHMNLDAKHDMLTRRVRERFDSFFVRRGQVSVIRLCGNGRLADFVATYRQYRKHHGVVYSARIAFGCAFRGLPF